MNGEQPLVSTLITSEWSSQLLLLREWSCRTCYTWRLGGGTAGPSLRPRETKDGVESLTVTPSHTGTYFKHRSITFFDVQVWNLLQIQLFRSYLPSHLTRSHDSSKRKHLSKEIPPGTDFGFFWRLISFKQLSRGILLFWHHRNSERIKMKLEKKTFGQFYVS